VVPVPLLVPLKVTVIPTSKVAVQLVLPVLPVIVSGKATPVPVVPNVQPVQLAAVVEAMKLVSVAVFPVFPDWVIDTICVPLPQAEPPVQVAVTVETIGDAVPMVPAPGRKTPLPVVIDSAPEGSTKTVTAFAFGSSAMRPSPGLLAPGLADMLKVCARATLSPSRQTSAADQNAKWFLII